MEDFFQALIPISICVVLPALIVWLIFTPLKKKSGTSVLRKCLIFTGWAVLDSNQ